MLLCAKLLCLAKKLIPASVLPGSLTCCTFQTRFATLTGPAMAILAHFGLCSLLLAKHAQLFLKM
jgi:hypothetical protein